MDLLSWFRSAVPPPPSVVIVDKPAPEPDLEQTMRSSLRSMTISMDCAIQALRDEVKALTVTVRTHDAQRKLAEALQGTVDAQAGEIVDLRRELQTYKNATAAVERDKRRIRNKSRKSPNG